MRNDMIIEDASRDTAAVFASVTAVVLAAVYWVSRLGFPNPVIPVASTLGLSLFLVVAPLWTSRAMQRQGHNEWWSSHAFVAIACIAVTALGGMLADVSGFSAIWLFAGAGFALAVLTIARWLGRGRTRESVALILGIAVFAVWCAGVIWGSRYKMPLFWETFAYRANIHHDTFYYASMANMIDTYGVPSTGLDGVPLIRYHYGSAWLFGQWSHLLHTDVLSFYSLGYPVIVLPLFFSALLQLSAELGAKLRDDWRAWVVFIAATVGFIPAVALDSLAVWNSNAFISESYLMGMPVFLFALGCGLAFWRSDRSHARSALFYLIFAPLIITALGFLKVSLMILAFAIGCYVIVRKSLYRQPVVIGSALLSAVAAAITYHYVSLPAQNGGISPFHFMRYDARQGWQQFFPLIHFLWTWIYVALRLWEERIGDVAALRSAVRSRAILDVEVLLLVAVLGFLPGEIVSIHGGSAVYFSDVQRWVALSFIMARIGSLVAARSSRSATPDARRPSPGSDRFPIEIEGPPTLQQTGRTLPSVTGVGRRTSGVALFPSWLKNLRLSRLLYLFVAAPFIASMLMNLTQLPLRVFRTNLTTRQDLKSAQRDSTYYPIVTALREIATLPESERKQSLLFIPQSNHQYWSMFTADDRCTFTPLIAPAVASVAMLDGMPAIGCAVTDQYNMTAYRKRERPQLPQDMTSEALCEKARAKGFKHVIVLEAPGNGIPRRKRVDCYLQSS
jgi:hypothetical protein